MGYARKLLGEAVKQMFEGKEEAFRIRDIATVALGRRPVRYDEYWVAATLTRTREWLERNEGITFVPVTEYYFEYFDGTAPPRDEYEAKKCVAGLGRGHGTAGIRRLWPKAGNKNDLISLAWLEQGYKSGGNKWYLVTNRVLLGYKAGALTEVRARSLLEDNFHRLLPYDLVTFRKLLPLTRQMTLMLNGSNK
jgi:hypothetical protein